MSIILLPYAPPKLHFLAKDNEKFKAISMKKRRPFIKPKCRRCKTSIFCYFDLNWTNGLYLPWCGKTLASCFFCQKKRKNIPENAAKWIEKNMKLSDEKHLKLVAKLMLVRDRLRQCLR